MNKTININLGGIFFHIDEIAYEKLRLYLDAIRRSLSDDPQGRDEIINDIEHRIGEILSERIKDERQVVNENDIDEITKIMGKPEDYLVDEEIFDDETRTHNKKPNASNKKLYRDNEDKFLGGVSSGIAHYFGVDALWIRILWVVLVVAGFGSGIPIYLLLWILIPEAVSTAEKLQMKGEAVNISNIEKKIREEFQDVTSRVKDGVNDVTEKVKNSNFKKNFGGKSKSGLDEIVDVLTKIILTIFKVFGKFIGILLIIIASLTLMGLIFGALSFGSIEILDFGKDFTDYPPFFFDSVLPSWLLIIFTFIAIGIPFVVLFMLGLKILSSNVNAFSTTTKLSLLGIWIISLLGLGFAGINFATQRAYDGVSNQTEELPFVAMDTLKLKMIGNDNLSNRTELRREYGFETVYDNDQQKLYSTRINVDIKSTENHKAFVKIRKESQGNNRLNANNDAKAIEYQFNLTDENLLLNGYFLSDFKNKFKDQLVNITVYLPINSILYLDKTTRTFLDDVDNIQNIYDRKMPKHYYKMTENGLECLDCDPSIFGDSYRKKHENFNLKIDKEGIELKINHNNGHSDAKVKIDENGIIIQ